MENLFVCPPVHRPLVVKVTSSGATVLKKTNDVQFKQRIQGSKSHTLLANAVLVENSIANPRDLAGYKKPTGKRVTKKPVPEKISCQNSGTSDVEQLNSGKKYRLNKKLIRGRIFAFLLTQKKPVAHFVTITFPKQMTEDGGYQALNAWLTYCRKYLHLREYLFVAETQPQTGTVHFHILVPQYLNIQKANRAMGGILKKMIRTGRLDWNIHAANRYNGVDLAKNRKTKRVTNFALMGARKALVNYLLKYVTKNDGGFSHYAWHNSRGFSAMMLSVSLTEAEAKYLKIRGALDLTKLRATEYAYFVPWSGQAAPWFAEALRIINTAILENSGRSRQLLTYNPN